MKPKLYIANFSGGRDSTAMLIKIVENRLPLDYILFCDTGAEFKEIYGNIFKVNAFIKDSIGKEITIMIPRYSLIQYLTEYKRVKGKSKGLPYSFPTPKCRWCSFVLKINQLKKFRKNFIDKYEIYEYIGYTRKERQRYTTTTIREEKFGVKVLSPLIDLDLSTQEITSICYSNGFNFGGLYNYVNRASCWCCPLKTLKEFEYLMKFRPEYWNKIKSIETSLKEKGIKNWKFAYIKGKPTSCKELEKLINGE